MKCLILEDEPLAIDVLSSYIADTPGLELKAVSKNVFEAFSSLRELEIDLIFVDINLPKVNGLDFIKSLNNSYKVILTTAYHEYALRGFDLGVIDYLLKPIEYSRFLQAINKIYDLKFTPGNAEQKTKERKCNYFNVAKKQVKVYNDEIVYVESLKSYVKIHLDNKHLVTKFKIGDLENIFADPTLKRVHKSFIVNINKVSAASASLLEIGTIKIPIGRHYKSSLKLTNN